MKCRNKNCRPQDIERVSYKFYVIDGGRFERKVDGYKCRSCGKLTARKPK